MQNWNDGKVQEFKDRRVYDVAHSTLKRNGCPTEAAAPAEKAEQAAGENAVYLFATATCPNCKIACAALDKAGVVYEKILANDNPEAAKKFEIKQAPTLVIVENGTASKYAGVSDIKRYIAGQNA